MHDIIRKITIGEYASMTSRPGGHLPSVHFLTVVIDHADDTGAREVREQRIAFGDQLGIYAAKTYASTVEGALFHPDDHWKSCLVV